MAGAAYMADWSTGAKTVEGIERIRRAPTRHGWYSHEAKAEQTEAPRVLRSLQALIRGMTRGDGR
jgi:hypothetical protein